MQNNPFILTTKSENFEEIGGLVTRSPFISKFIKNNPALLLAVSDAAEFVAGLDIFNNSIFESIIRNDSHLLIACQNAQFKTAFKQFLLDVFKEKKIKPRDPQPAPSTPPPVTSPDEIPVEVQPTTQPTDNQPDIELLKLILDIPIARPGDIITSEHHNTLRRAIRAIAALTHNTELSSIHTFAPILLPVAFDKTENGAVLGDNDKLDKDHDWKVIYNKAVVPTVREMGGAGGIVRGAFFVRLPENNLIKSMVVRGKRLDEEAQDPKSFNVTLFRFDPDKTNIQPTKLIDVDLKEENGVFKRIEAPKSTDLRIDNAKYQYFVSAVWQDEDDSSGFEIRSIQIFCEG